MFSWRWAQWYPKHVEKFLTAINQLHTPSRWYSIIHYQDARSPQHQSILYLPHLFIKMLMLLPRFLPFYLLDRGINIRFCLFQVSLQTPNWVAALLLWFCFESKTICCIQTRRWVFTWPLVYRLFFVWLRTVVRRRIKNFPSPPTHSTLCTWLYFIHYRMWLLFQVISVGCASRKIGLLCRSFPCCISLCLLPAVDTANSIAGKHVFVTMCAK
jgi:hypothetical protein